MAASTGRFVVEDGEIVDTHERQIISLDQLSKLASPDEQARIASEITSSGWDGADQTADPSIMARATTISPTSQDTSQSESLPARPSLDQFMEVAKADNPDVPDRDLRKYWAQHYSDINPKSLPTLEAFLPAAKEDNPDVPESQLRAYWNETYGDLGASEKEPTDGDLSRGFKTAFKQLPQLGYGLTAGAGAALESATGEGGIGTKLKQFGVTGYQKKGAEIADQAKASDDFNYAYDQAKEGNFGALVDWMQYGLGYAGAQAVQMLATGGLGYAAGKVGLQTVAKTTAEKLVAKEAARLAATGEAKQVASTELTKMATANVAAKIGQTAAIGAAAVGMEGGEIFGDLTAQSVQDGRRLGGDELAKAFGASLGAGALEFVGDKIGLDLLVGKSPLGKLAGSMPGIAGRATRGAIAGTTAGAIEGGTEYGQTLIEQAGKGEDPFSDASRREAVNAAALGMLGGTVIGAGSGALRSPSKPVMPTPTTPPETTATTPTAAIPSALGVGNPDVGVDETIKTAWDLLHEDEQIQARNAFEAQRQAEQQLMQGPERPLTVPRPGYEIPILPAVQPEPEPVIAPGHAFTPRQTLEPDPREVLRQERHGLIGRVMPTATEDMISTSDSGSSPEPAPDVPLQSAADLAYPPSERDRMPSQQDLLRRQNRPQPRSGYEVPTLPAAQSAPPPAIVPGSAFVARNEAALTPKERIAQERAKLVEMKAKQAPTSTPQASTETPRTIVDRVMPKAIDRAYPSVSALHELAKAKGFDIESPVFRTMTKMATGKEHLDSLSPAERDKFAATLNKLTAKQTPDVVASPTTQALKPVQPIAPSSDAVTAPRSALPPEQNAEMLLRAEKGKADLEIDQSLPETSLVDFLKQKGGIQDQGGELSTMEVDGERKPFSKNLINPKGLTLDDAAELAHEAGYIQDRDISLLLHGIDRETRGQGGTTDWYKQLTTGPKPLSREAIDTAIGKIITDHGVDTGKAVERVKAALLNDGEFDGTQWGEDAAAILRGEWPAWVPKPEPPSQPGPVQTSESVSASPPTEGTTTTAPPAETAITTDAAAGRLDVNSAQPIDTAAHEAAPSPTNDHPEPSAAQIEAGNFRMGHLKIAGLDVTIEHPEGSTRTGTNAQGQPWERTVSSHYGYFRGVDHKGKDGEPVDVFVKPGTPEDYAGPAFVIDQKNMETGALDEHKTILGASSMDEAQALYRANYPEGEDRILSAKKFTLPEFKLWLKAGNKAKPVGNAKDQQTRMLVQDQVKRLAKKAKTNDTKPAESTITPRASEKNDNKEEVATTNRKPNKQQAAKPEDKKQTDLTDGLAAFDNELPYEQRPNEPSARNRALAREALAAFDGIHSVRDSEGVLGRPRGSRSDRQESERLAGLERAGIRTPAVGISKDLATKGRVDLRGYAVTSMADLATLAQVFRNPRVETLRFFYVKDGAIVGHEGISSRLPGSSMAFPISSGDLERMTVGERRARQQKAVDDMADRMLRLGADGYYILHNHPSGISRPSHEDVQLTRRFQEELPGLLGHVVIDSNEYSTINRSGSVSTERLPEKRDELLEPYRPHAQLATIIRSPETLAAVGKAMQTEEGYVTIVYLSGSDGKTRAIQEIPEALFTNTKEATNFLRGQARAFGAVATAAYAKNSESVVSAARELQKNGSLLDIAVSTVTGEVHSLTKYGHYMEKGETFGVPEKLIGGTRVSEPDSPSIVKDATTTYAPSDGLTSDQLNNPQFSGMPAQEPEPKTPSRHAFAKDLTAAQQAALARIHGTPKTWQQNLNAFKQTWKRDLVQGLFDQYAPILDYSKKGYMLSRMAKGGDGTLEALMLYGKPYVDEDGAYRVQYSEKDGLQGFSKVLSALQGEHDRFFEWVAAKRADRLQSIGLENLYSEQDIATLKTLNHGKMPDGTSREVAYLRALKELNDWNDTMVKIGVDSGLISPETRETFKDVPYVPFYRLQEEGVTTGFGATPGLVNQYAWKKLKGGTAHLNDDLLANLLQNWSHIITASAKNRAAKETLRAAELAGVAEQVPSGTPGKGLVEYLEGGKAQVFNVSDPALLDAIAALHYAGLGSIGKPFQAMKRYLSFAVTVNPAYKIRNLIRDSIHSIGTSELSYNPLKNIAEGSKATTMTSETRAQLLAGGGMIRFGSMLDGNNADRTRRLIEKGVDPQYILSNDGAITKFWKQRIQPAFEAYQEFGDRGEQVNRAALYKQLLAKGMTHQEASFWARDLMDFSMAGKWGAVRILTQVVPFMNARLQGLYKLGRATKADYQKMGTTLAAVGLASIGLLLAYGDDDDWKKREDSDRENFWWFKVGGIAVRIPKPFEIGVIGTIAERSVEYLTDHEMTGKRFGERMAATVFNQLSMNPTPQLVKPLMDLYANKDAFTGRPIETMGMERLRKVDRYTDRTSEAARFLGELGLPDPAQLAMGRWDTLSPVQIDSLIKGYFSWLGTTATTALDYGIRPFVDRGERPNMQLRNVFLAGNFVETLPTGSSRYVSQLYSQAAEIEQAYASYRDALKRGDTEKASEILRDDREKLSQYKMIEKVKREESALSERMKLVQASARLSGDEKRTQLDALQDRKHRLAQRVAERQMQ